MKTLLFILAFITLTASAQQDTIYITEEKIHPVVREVPGSDAYAVYENVKMALAGIYLGDAYEVLEDIPGKYLKFAFVYDLYRIQNPYCHYQVEVEFRDGKYRFSPVKFTCNSISMLGEVKNFSVPEGLYNKEGVIKGKMKKDLFNFVPIYFNNVLREIDNRLSKAVEKW